MVQPLDWVPLIPQPVLQVIEHLGQAGHEAWLVGGCVRDLAIGRAPQDFDLSTSALPEQVQAIFPRTFATGLLHGTVTVLVDGHPIEVTTFRSEGAYTDGRRPDSVAFETDLRLDLSRRDFTINSMAYHPVHGLTDPFGGWTDLQNRQLRTVGDARTRFSEDALRMLRAVRLTLTYDLTPDTALISAIQAERHRANRLSIERIIHELKRMMASPHGAAIRTFAESDILPVIANRLFGLVPVGHHLTDLLADWIRPAWHADQATPLFYLACRLAEKPVLLEAQAGVPVHHQLRRLLAPRSLLHLPHVFRENCRLSRQAAREGHAVLYAAGLRLWLERPDGCTPQDLARLLRVLKHRLALDLPVVHRCAADAWALLELLCPGHPGVRRELVNLRQLMQLDYEADVLVEIPIGLRELAIDGRDPVFGHDLRGPQLGRLLERLLSYVQLEPTDNTPEALRERVRNWLKPGS